MTRSTHELFVRLTAEVKAWDRHRWASCINDELEQLIRLLNNAVWTGQHEPRLFGQGTKGMQT